VAGNIQGCRVKEKFGEGDHTWKEEGRSDRGIGKGKGMTRMSKQLWEESRKEV
jgi:hypothetical protein